MSEEMEETNEKPEHKLSDEDVIKWILACRDEADEAKRDRMDTNRQNYDMFHLRYNFDHKEEGQSQEVLSRQSMAVEQNKSFFQQALADLGDWWTAENQDPNGGSLFIKPEEITKLTNHMLEEAHYFSHVGNSIESAMLASLAISKTSGKMIPKPKFVSRKKGRGKGMKRWVEKVEDESWQIKFDCVRAENFYPDPTGKGLYEIEDSFPDFYELLEMAEHDEDFDKAMIEELPRAGMADNTLEESEKSRETGQNTSTSGHRPKPKLTEYWGDILDPVTGEVCYENVQAIIANDTHLILKPRPNPLWHQKSPYTVSPLMEVANSVWHKAPMDAPTQHNRSLIEIYNLMLDAGFNQVHAISQIRKDWLDNPAQIADGIRPGMALATNSLCPPGGKVLEPLTQVTIPPEVFSIFNIMGQEFNSSALTNDLRQGVMPFRAVKATEVVEASQTITSVFQGMAKNYEGRQSTKELQLAWETTAQNWDRIDREVFITLFGKQRGEELSQYSPEDVFANTVNGVRFRVYGVTQTLAKAQDFRKLTTLLQTIAASPALMEEYLKKYDLGKTLGEIMTTLNIDKTKLEIPQAVQNTMSAPQGQPEPQPDQMSQTPQASAMSAMMGGDTGIPQTEFPGSPALIGGQQQ